MNAALPDVGGNFVMLRADSLRLLLPQEDVGEAEYLEGEPSATADAGVFRHGEGEAARTVLALSPQLRPLQRFPQGRFLLTRLRAGDDELVLAWNEVRVLIDAKLARQPLPPVMRLPGAPIDGYVDQDGELLLCSSAAQVLAAALAAGG